MNYQTSELRRALAGDYAIGLMPPTAGRRFERLLNEDPALRRELGQWHDTLANLTLELAEQPVPARVWRAIEARLDPPVEKTSWWGWLSGSLLAGVLVLAVAFGLLYNRETLNYHATLVAQGQPPAMEIRAHHDYLDVESLGSTWPAEDRSLELWAIAPGGKPVSLGVVFENRRARQMRLNLNAEQRKQLGVDVTLAVSLEPRGGSPSGSPTGPVLYAGVLSAL